MVANLEKLTTFFIAATKSHRYQQVFCKIMRMDLKVWAVISLLVVWLSYDTIERRSVIAEMKTILEYEVTKDMRTLKEEIADTKRILEAIGEWKNEILEIKMILKRELTEDSTPLKKEIADIKRPLMDIGGWKNEIKMILEHEISEEIRTLKKEFPDIKRILWAIGTWKNIIREIKMILEQEVAEDIRALKKDVVDLRGAILDTLGQEEGVKSKFIGLLAKVCSVAELAVSHPYVTALCTFSKIANILV